MSKPHLPSGDEVAATLGLPPAPDGMRWCVSCLQRGERAPLALAAFYVKATPDLACIACHVLQRRVTQLARLETPTVPPLPVRLPAIHHAAPDRYANLFAAQRGLCLLCEEPEYERSPDGTPLPLTYLGVRTVFGPAECLLCARCDDGMKKFRYQQRRLARALAFLIPGALPQYEATVHVEPSG